MTAFVLLVLFTVIAISAGINVYLLKSRKKTSDREITSVLMQGIQEISELATIRQSFQSIVMYENSRSLLGFQLPGTHKKFILKYSGNVVVGTDLSKANIEWFISGKVKITLPRSSILDITADIKSIEIYDQHSGIFTSLSLDEQNRAIEANLLEIEKETDYGELLARSDENAKNILSSLCRSLGVVAELEFIDEPALPDSKSDSPISPDSLETQPEIAFSAGDLPEHEEKVPLPSFDDNTSEM